MGTRSPRNFTARTKLAHILFRIAQFEQLFSVFDKDVLRVKQRELASRPS
jgi:hypothetical protein